jgi:Helicase HerA, central domain
MTREAKLIGKIFELTRGDLETAHFPFPRLDAVVSAMQCVRISRLSRFWQEGESGDRSLVEQSTVDLIAGLFGQSCPWLYFLKGSPTAIECWYGTSESKMDRGSLRSNLGSAFPDIRFKNSLSPETADFKRLRHALVLTGTPSSKIDPRHGTSADQIEKVCRGMYGSNWVYAVYAEPAPRAETVMAINEVSELVQDVYATYLLKSTASDERNRVAQRYVELLEAKLKRLEQGRALGMWVAHTMLLTDNASSLGRAQALLHSAFSGETSLPDPVRACTCQLSLQDSPYLEPLTSGECAILARPPREEYPGYEVVAHARFGVAAHDTPVGDSHALRVGAIYDRGSNTGNQLKIPLRDLTKHGLIVGVTGSGKTNTCLQLLDQIWDAGRGVPFLVIESAKSEYRSLLHNPRFKGLSIFTVGDETTSPLRLNPFEVQEGVLVQTHIDYVKSLFSAAFVLYPPMPYVLEQSLQEIYEDRGWELAANTNYRGRTSERVFPTITDLAAKVDAVVDRMGYDERLTMDVKAGLLARINQLRLSGGKGLMFDTRRSLDFTVLFDSPCILELKQIVSDDEKAFIIGLVLIFMYERYEAGANPRQNNLNHVTLIEEAHRLLRNVSTEQGSEISANPKGKAIEVFANILSEIRAYGEGILIAEQIPTKLTPDAIKNTNLKIIHRLVSEDDRRAVGSTMNLTESQSSCLTTLRAGEAVAYTEGMQKAVLLTIPLSQTKADEKDTTNKDIRETMASFWRRNKEVLRRFPSCSNCTSTDANQNCGNRQSRHVDGLWAASFKRLFNTLRSNKALILDAYSDFCRSSQPGPDRYKQLKSNYCLFVEMVDAEIERRGEFTAWPHEDVEKAIALACSVAAHLESNFGKTEKKVMEKAYAKDLIALSNLFKRLHKVNTLPYAGCRHCAEPCHYRFDMKSVNKDYVGDFRSAFTDPHASMSELARICWDASSQAFLSKDTRSRRGASLCFAVQQFSKLGVSPSVQETVVREVADQLDQLA